MTGWRVLAGSAALGLALLPAGGAVEAQRRLDPAGVQACTSAERVATELRSGVLPVAQARQRLQLVYDVARTSSTPPLRQVAQTYLGQVATADASQLLLMAEQFTAVCR